MQSFSRNVLAAPDTLGGERGRVPRAHGRRPCSASRRACSATSGSPSRAGSPAARAHALAGRDPLRRRPARPGRHRARRSSWARSRPRSSSCSRRRHAACSPGPRVSRPDRLRRRCARRGRWWSSASSALLLLSRRLDLLGARRRRGLRARACGCAAPSCWPCWSRCCSRPRPSPSSGPIGFVGLVAPTLVRLLAPKVPGLHRHRVLLPVSGLAGVALVAHRPTCCSARSSVRRQAVEVPTGVMTSLIGAVVLVVLACRLRASSVRRAGREPRRRRAPGCAPASRRAGRARPRLTVVVSVGALVGDRMLLLGDLGDWAPGPGRSGGHGRDGHPRCPACVAALARG